MKTIPYGKRNLFEGMLRHFFKHRYYNIPAYVDISKADLSEEEE